MVFLKTLFILFLIFYLLSKVGGYLLKSVLGKLFSQVNRTDFQQRQSKAQYKQPVDGNVRIDHIPKNDEDQSTDLGGDYVDYEEVK